MSTTQKTKYGNGVQLTDWGQPEYLDGGQMQFMVTNEKGYIGTCYAYFAYREDAELFAKAKADQLSLASPRAKKRK